MAAFADDLIMAEKAESKGEAENIANIEMEKIKKKKKIIKLILTKTNQKLC
jgi:hypothetical protein